MILKLKKILSSIIVVICIALIAAFVLNFLSPKSQAKMQNEISPVLQQHELVLFYSNQCPHCTQVRKYLADNHCVEKYNLQEKEISVDQKNRKDFINTLHGCFKNIKELEVNLPVLWDGTRCFQGADEVMKEILNFKF